MKRILFNVIAALLVALSNTSSAGDTENRIKGVSEFLLDRANDNWLYMVEAQIKDNKLFACYFPNTYRQMTSGNLKLLLSSGNEVWSSVVEEDLQGLSNRYLIRVMASEKFGQSLDGARDNYTEKVLQRFTVEHKGRLYPLNVMPIDASDELKATLNQFSASIADAFSELGTVRDKAVATRNSDSCAINPAIVSDAKVAVKKLESAIQQLKSGHGNLRPRSEVFNTTQGLSAIATAEIDELLIRLLALDSADVSDVLELSRGHASKGYVMRVLEAEAILDRLSELELAPVDLVKDSKQYSRFRRYILSVAVLSDAESPDQVKVALQEMTLPPVSFGLKRQPEETTVMLTSYLGVSAGVERNSDEGNKGIYGLFAPVGLEYSRGLSNKRSLSLMLAPVDFAYPLSLELKDQEESVEWKDIVRPSLSLTYGLQDYPIAIGFSISRGRPLTAEGESDKETQYFLFVAFDMPLFQLF